MPPYIYCSITIMHLIWHYTLLLDLDIFCGKTSFFRREIVHCCANLWSIL